MKEIYGVIAVLIGIAVRLVVPVLLTAVVVYLLRRLDAEWQREGKTAPIKVQKSKCWDTMHCPPERRKDCPGYVSELPCWQARRLSSGYLRNECLGCKVFLKAPVPSLR
jgi:hypothetical protein